MFKKSLKDETPPCIQHPRSLLPAATAPGSDVWRVFHQAEGVCVDFTVRVAPDADASRLLPSAIEYFGHCAGPYARGPGEVLAELHTYADFRFEDLPESLFRPPLGC